MANLTESPIYESGIFQLEKSTPALGGAPVIDGGVPSAGHANAQAQQLANRTANLNLRLTTAEEDIDTLQTEVLAGGSATDLALNLANTSDPAKGAALVGFKLSASGASPTTVSAAIAALSVNVMHFGAAGIGGDDTVATQAALAYALTSGKALYFPKGSYAISQPLIAQNKSLTVFGDGIGLSKIYIDHNGIGFKYTSTSAANNLTMKGLEIISADPDAISGLDIQFPGAVTLDQSQLTLEDVTVRAEGSSTWSYACIRLDGIMNPFLNRVVVRGTVAKTLYGVALEDQVVDATLDGVRAFLVGTGIFIGTACEGISIDNYTAVTVKRGVDANPLNNGPWVNISNFHINSSEYGIRLYNRSQSVITNGLLYANNFLGATEWKGISIETGANSSAGAHFNISNVIFNHQVFSGNTIGVNCIKAVYGIIHGCQFVNVIQPIVEDSKTNVVIKVNNQYPGVTNPVLSNGLPAGEPFRIVPILAQNRLYVQGGAAGSTPLIGVEGVDSVSGLSIAAKGAGANISFSSSGAGTGLTVNVPASSVNRVRVAGGAVGAAVKVDVIGTDTNAWLSIQGKGTGGITLPATISANYANDSAAATAGVPVGGVYHTSGTLKIRLT